MYYEAGMLLKTNTTVLNELENRAPTKLECSRKQRPIFHRAILAIVNQAQTRLYNNS
jgi:hypothetical protein